MIGKATARIGQDLDRSREEASRAELAAPGSTVATEELVWACARSALDQAGAARIRMLAGECLIDWDRAQALARQHGLLPLLRQSLKQAAQDLLPSGVCRSLDLSFVLGSCRNMMFSRQLVGIMEALSRNGVRAIPFKGPVLAASCYGSPCLREFVDLDVLIDRRDAVRAIELLAATGYFRIKALCDGHVVTHKRRGGIAVELQWDLARRWELAPSVSALDFDDLWARRESVKLYDTIVPGLGAEDSLVILCVHAARHGWNRLLWVCDVAEQIRSHPGLNWEAVVSTAARLHCLRRLRLGLLLASTLGGAEIPGWVRHGIETDPALPTLARHVRERLFRSAAPNGQPREATSMDECAADIDDLTFYVAVHEKRRDRHRIWLRFLRSRLKPNDADQATVPMNGAIALPARLVRPVRLVRVYGIRSAIRVLRALWAGR